ncbi:retrovirus-related pol polyprotein from transposon tnt 1-94 [Lasius niger]|uniref:Retrovirus-related pol polyprotein from transposon tnt 1-94 n=1 Tax=Lasius niger TaxID=67767 RepID=A0A0J7JU34_LASNI|nr:retrovirus-related pol polyprotein from transposon tnt 1-94 [Lasius niger]
MSSEVRKMNDYSEQEGAGLKVTVANDENLYSAGSDSMSVRVKVKSGDCVKTISKVMHVPNLSVNLSVSKIVKKGYVFLFDADGCEIYDEDDFVAQGEVKMTGTEINGIYRLDTVDARSNISEFNDPTNAHANVTKVTRKL